MTRDEWARKLLVQLASGHGNVNAMNQAKDYLAGKNPPITDDWKPSAKDNFEKKKKLPTVKEMTEAKGKNGPIGDEELE